MNELKRENDLAITRVLPYFKPLKQSREYLIHLSRQIVDYLVSKGISAEMPEEHHLTLGYLREFSREQLLELFSTLHSKANVLKEVDNINPNILYDESFNKLRLWKSFNNWKYFVVLVPHNPNSIFNHLIQNKEISPHITIAKLGNLTDKESEAMEKVHLPYIKKLRDVAFAEGSIGIDISSFNVDVKVWLDF